MSALQGLAEAFRFLTILPVPRSAERDDADVSWAATFFPVVGLVVGVCIAGALALPIPELPAAALALAVWVALTGALHEDGWADCMDGAFAPVDRRRRLEILKDPRVGAHGLTGTVVILLLRLAALSVLAPAAVVVAPILGRWAMAVSLAVVQPARDSGLGAGFARSPRPYSASAVTAVLMLGVAAWTSQPSLLLVWGITGLATIAWGAWLATRFGGLTGDGHGAVGLFAETAALYATIAVDFV